MYWKKTSCPAARLRSLSLVSGAFFLASSLLLLPGCGGSKSGETASSNPPPDAQAPLPTSEQQAKDKQVIQQATDEKGAPGGPTGGDAPPPK